MRHTERLPLAVSVNRDEHISATRPRILSFQSLSSSLPEITAHLVLERWLHPKRTSHPSGSRPSRLAARGPWLRLQPQKTLCSPPRPILAAGLASRTALWRSNALWLTVRAQRTHGHGWDRRRRAISRNGSANLRTTLPAPSPLIVSTPVVWASQPKALAASNGVQSLITW